MAQVLLRAGADQYAATALLASAATPTDIAILPGSASKTILVTRVIVSGTKTTAGLVDVLLIKRSTANSGGTSAAMTAVPYDSTNLAASAAPLSYTANPTPGTAVGTVARAHVPIDAPASVVGNVREVFDFGANGQPIVLRGVAEGLAVNLNSVTQTGGSFAVTFEWQEI